MSTEKIDAAAAATDQVQDIVGRALDILGQGFNGRIVKAITTMDSTAWPEPADYDAE